MTTSTDERQADGRVPQAAVTVAVVVERPTTREAIIRVLATDAGIRVVGQADDLASGLALLDQQRPRVVVVNMRLGGTDAPGVVFIRAAKERHPEIGVLSLKRRVDEHLLRTALDAGADACCLATTPENRLRSAIKAVGEGATWLDPEISRILLHPVVRRPVDPPRDDEGMHLSPREHEILQLLTEGYTNDEIATSLRCSEATIKTHLVHVFTKLNVHDRVSAAVAALRRGII
ncbi:MAG TPA: response regulator transcription factor [Candidatus Sulfotelmatobacter sp.]|nr:response regulator transcription factor [Candidatus Sulfotelmatobacter sp.]